MPKVNKLMRSIESKSTKNIVHLDEAKPTHILILVGILVFGEEFLRLLLAFSPLPITS